MIKHIFEKYKKITMRKKKKELSKRFPSSITSLSFVYDERTVLEGENVIHTTVNICSSTIGFATVIGYRSYLKKCLIGRFCSIASNVKIQPYTHPTSFVSTYPGFFDTAGDYPFGKGTAFFDEVLKCNNEHFCSIGNDVWIGENVTIKGGVTIGDGAVIGMGAVVTKDVPPYAIAGGVPAKIIRYRFNQNVIDSLLRIKWWNWPIDTIKERREEFIDVEAFINKYDIKKDN